MSAGHAESALHPVLVAAFKADAALTTKIAGRVFEWPKAGEAFPMVTLGDYTSSPNDTSDSVGSDIDATIHTWATGPTGRIEARKIGEMVSDILHRGTLTVPGFKVVFIQRTFGDVFRDEASEAGNKASVAHGVFRYRIVLEATA